MSIVAGGLVSKLALLGSADGRKFLKRFPGESSVVGHYEIEHTPHELALAIATIRAYHVTSRRVLSLGSRTMGAERAIMESIGATSLDWLSATTPESPAHARNIAALEGDGVVVRHQADGQYDLVLVAGDDPMSYPAVAAYARAGGLVAILGSGVAMGWPNLRQLFFRFRNGGHRQEAYTGSGYGEVGVGVFALTHHPAAEETPARTPPPRDPAAGGTPAPRPTRPAKAKAKAKPKAKAKANAKAKAAPRGGGEP